MNQSNLTRPLAKFEQHGAIFVANIALTFGSEAGVTAYTVTLIPEPDEEGKITGPHEESERIVLPTSVFTDILVLFCTHDDHPMADYMYARIKPEHLPADRKFRPIP